MEQQQPKLAEEMQKMPYEPLLPIEKKLIVWSLSLGIVLLVVLVLISRAFIHAVVWRNDFRRRGNLGRDIYRVCAALHAAIGPRAAYLGRSES